MTDLVVPHDKSKDLLERQERMFDAIRYTILMIRNSYKSLQEVLGRVTFSDKPGEDDFVTSLIHAWTVIDCINRLRLLINSAPGISTKVTAVKLFLHQTKKVEVLRQIFQHANNASEIRKMVDNRIPFWGYLTWLRLVDSRNGVIGTFGLGTRLKNEEIPILNPIGRRMNGKLGLIIIHTSNAKLSISEMYIEVKNLLTYFDSINFFPAVKANSLFAKLSITFEPPKEETIPEPQVESTS